MKKILLYGICFSVLAVTACKKKSTPSVPEPPKQATLKSIKLNDVDFTESDLTDSRFYECDLLGATFDNTIIEKVDFRTSFNYSINPETNRIKKSKFSLSGISGLLDKYDIFIE